MPSVPRSRASRSELSRRGGIVAGRDADAQKVDASSTPSPRRNANYKESQLYTSEEKKVTCALAAGAELEYMCDVDGVRFAAASESQERGRLPRARVETSSQAEPPGVCRSLQAGASASSAYKKPQMTPGLPDRINIRRDRSCFSPETRGESRHRTTVPPLTKNPN